MLTNSHSHPPTGSDQTGRRRLHMESTQALQARDHFQALICAEQAAQENDNEALVAGTEQGHQLRHMLEQGMAAAHRLEELHDEIRQGIANLDAALQATLAWLVEQQPGVGEPYGAVAAQGQVAGRAAARTATAKAEVDFTIRCLGVFAIFCNGQQLNFPRNRKVESVLKYLIIHREQPVSRDILMQLGWPNGAPEAAANSLNTTISILRSSLSKALKRRLPGSPILLEDGHYRLNPELRLHIDVAEFDTYCARGLDHERSGRDRQAMADYQAAVTLYGGDLLMGDLYDDWTIIERERLASTFLTLLSKLGTYCMTQQHYEEAIRHAQHLLEHDPCREDAHRLLMQCFVHLDHRAQALHQFDLCRTLLRREMQIDPAPETVALRQRIAEGDAL